MAREQVAKLYEVVTALAVRKAKSGTKFEHCEVLREVNLKGVSIRTDIVLGSAENPQVIFMITHSTKEVMWKEKFDRDSAEFLELFSAFPKTIRGNVLVIFNDRILPGLKKISEFYLDAVLLVTEISGGDVLLEMANDPDLVELLSDEQSNEAKLDTLSSYLKRKPHWAKGLTVFSAAIHETLLNLQIGKKEKASYAHAVQRMLIKRGANAVPRKCRNTRFNRGISKLALFNGDEIKAIARGDRVRGTFDWATEDIYWPLNSNVKGQLLKAEGQNTFRCVDPEILGGPLGRLKSPTIVEGLFDSLTPIQVEAIIDHGKQEMMSRYMARVRGKSVFNASLRFIQDNVRVLLDGKTLGLLLNQIALDPRGTFVEKCGKATGWQAVNWNWLFTALVALFKSTAKTKNGIGSKQGYGYSKIAEAMITPKYRTAVEHSILQHHEYCLRALDGALIMEVGNAMAKWLKGVPLKLLESQPQHPYRYLVLSEIEDKWMPHAVDVLPAMIEIASRKHKLPLEKTYTTSCLAVASGAGGTAGRTNVYRCMNTIVWYKAAHIGHQKDKRKEIQSTVASWRQRWDVESNAFQPNSDIKKTILVIDGDWEEEDLRLLYAFGWDEFLYPDELDRLPDLVV